ncbi:MAG: hypothetical protein IPM63_08285 [Acidobacteriota bacterium]|nr:MAG: hypothetical protein IPM63_08285 [Acidobacteriota bacterium]
MSPVVRNIIAFVAGVVVGSIVNMGILMVGWSIVQPPEGMDPMNAESIAASAHLLKPIHFLFPFLAHALGTFVGAFVAALIAASHKMTFALAIGVLTLLGGIWAATMIPAPVWFIVLDLVLAYIPMAWIAGTLATRRSA